MTRSDQHILYTALAFIAVYLKEPEQAHDAEPASLLARHIDAYCQQNNVAIPEVSTADSHQQALNEALTTLESILTDGLTFTTEQAAEQTVRRLKKMI